jgi:hypothetical protein
VTTESHSTVGNHQNPSKRKDLPAYKSETHLYLQSIYQTLPYHTAQERQNQQERIYQSFRHHQYNAVASLLLKRNNYKHRWHQPAPQQLLSPLNPCQPAEPFIWYPHQQVEELSALADYC